MEENHTGGIFAAASRGHTRLEAFDEALGLADAGNVSGGAAAGAKTVQGARLLQVVSISSSFRTGTELQRTRAEDSAPGRRPRRGRRR